MTLRCERFLGLTHSALWIILFAIFAPALYELARTTDNEPDSYVQTLRYMEPYGFVNEIEEVEAEARAPAVSMQNYFPILVRLQNLDHLMRAWHASGMLADRAMEDHIANYELSSFTLTNDLYNKYMERWGPEAFFKAREAYDADHPGWYYQQEHDWGLFVPYMARAWFTSLLFAALLFMVRLKREDLRVIPELDRIAFWTLIWPIGLFRYPHRVNVLNQLRRAKQRIACFFSMLLSLSPLAAAAKAMGEKSSETDPEVTGNTLVMDLTPSVSFAGGIMVNKIFANDVVLHKGPVGWSEATASWGRFSLDFWSANALNKPASSDERDYGGWWRDSFTGSKISYTVGAYYIDIGPLNSTRGGDFVYPFAELDAPVWGGLTASLRVEADILTMHVPDTSEYTATLGLKKSVELTPWLSFEHGSYVTSAEGAFGQPPVRLYRDEESFAIKLTKSWSAFLSLKSYWPFGGSGHENNASYGVGLSYAY